MKPSTPHKAKLAPDLQCIHALNLLPNTQEGRKYAWPPFRSTPNDSHGFNLHLILCDELWRAVSRTLKFRYLRRRWFIWPATPLSMSQNLSILQYWANFWWQAQGLLFPAPLLCGKSQASKLSYLFTASISISTCSLLSLSLLSSPQLIFLLGGLWSWTCIYALESGPRKMWWTSSNFHILQGVASPEEITTRGGQGGGQIQPGPMFPDETMGPFFGICAISDYLAWKWKKLPTSGGDFVAAESAVLCNLLLLYLQIKRAILTILHYIGLWIWAIIAHNRRHCTTDMNALPWDHKAAYL